MKRLILSTLLLALLPLSQALAATCSVSEFTSLITDLGGNRINIPLVTAPTPRTQVVTATAPAAIASAFTSSTRYLWIYCDEVMHMQLGTSPTTGLTTSDFRIPAGGFWVGLSNNDVREGTLRVAFCDADCS